MEPQKQEQKQEKSLTQEEVNYIVAENNVVIPASLLFFYVQFTDIVSRRGAVRPDEMASVGRNYNYSSSLIQKLIQSKLQESGSSSDLINENSSESIKIKKKKKKKKQLDM